MNISAIVVIILIILCVPTAGSLGQYHGPSVPTAGSLGQYFGPPVEMTNKTIEGPEPGTQSIPK